MTDDEERHVRALGRWFYGNDPANVNDELANVLAKMLAATIDGSRAMGFVPRPTGGPPGVAWVVSNAVRSWWEYHRDDRVYETVRRTVALKYKSVYTMAELGL
jgi:hypothetical protein